MRTMVVFGLMAALGPTQQQVQASDRNRAAVAVNSMAAISRRSQ
jgi:hypothetical protein